MGRSLLLVLVLLIVSQFACNESRTGRSINDLELQSFVGRTAGELLDSLASMTAQVHSDRDNGFVYGVSIWIGDSLEVVANFGTRYYVGMSPTWGDGKTVDDYRGDTVRVIWTRDFK